MGGAETDTALRKARAIGHAAPPDGSAIPPPPYQLRGCSFLMVGAAFNLAEISALVPRELEVVEDATGGFYMYSAPLGWGIAPYTATLAWVDVKGFDSADGSHARYMLFGGFSGTAFQALRYNPELIEGEAYIMQDAKVVTGSGGPRDQVHLRLAARLSDEPPTSADGTHFYITPTHDGGLCIIPVAFSYDLSTAEPMLADILAPKDTVLGQMKPQTLTWAAWLTQGVITIGNPSPLFDQPAARATMSTMASLNLLSQLGKAAVAISENGEVLFQNEAAERLAGDGFSLRDRRFGVADEVLGPWSKAVKLALGASIPWWQMNPVPLPRRSTSIPLLAQLVPQGSRGDDRKVLIVLLTDPERSPDHEPTRALQLLGLTRAEARIAALVGEGMAPREVAQQLGNSLSTVRSALKLVYGKLGIGRQSELAGLVVRIGSLGI